MMLGFHCDRLLSILVDPYQRCGMRQREQKRHHIPCACSLRKRLTSILMCCLTNVGMHECFVLIYIRQHDVPGSPSHQRGARLSFHQNNPTFQRSQSFSFNQHELIRPSFSFIGCSPCWRMLGTRVMLLNSTTRYIR